jgi:hypothetical protein
MFPKCEVGDCIGHLLPLFGYKILYWKCSHCARVVNWNTGSVGGGDVG